MLNDKYTVEAGRGIKRNGKPFVALMRSYNGDKCEGYAFPATDADTFAHYAAAAPELVNVLRAVMGAYDIGQPDTPLSALGRARRLLAKIKAAEDR